MLPVIVVGGGPVGLTAALLLARGGVPSVVLETAPCRRAVGSRSICLQRDVLDILDRVGVGSRIASEGVTWWTGRTYYRSDEVLTISFPPQPSAAFPPFTNLGQSRVEVLLDEAVARTPLVSVRWSSPVTSVQQDAAGVVVSLADGSSVAGSHCIAADGARSVVRSELGLSFDGESFDEQFLICDVRARLPFAAERHFHFDPAWNPGRQVLVHPQPDDVWRIDWQVPEDFDLASARASGSLDRRIRAIVGSADYALVWASAYRFHQRCVPRMAVGRVLLAGDAAHVMSPFGARGLNSGIQDAENAAWKIALDRSGLGGPSLLSSYDVERRAAAEENLAVTGRTMRFLVPRTAADRAHLEAVLAAAVSDPAARGAIDSGKLAEPFWYLSSPLTTGTPPSDFPTASGVARPLVAGVLCPDAPLHGGGRLRSLFGPGFTVLGNASCPDVRVVPPAELADDGALAGLLGLDAGGTALVRPDGHLAAVLPAGTPVESALRTACGW